MKHLFKKFYFLSLVSFIFTYSSSLAVEVRLPLFVANSDAFAGSLDVSLIADESLNATAFQYSLNGEVLQVEISNLKQGIVLYQLSGKDVAILTSQDFTSASGGSLTLTYLHDGVRSVFKKFNFGINRQGQNWQAYTVNSQGTPQGFLQLYLRAKKLLGKVIGIDSITAK